MLAFLLVLLPEIGVAHSFVEEVRSVSPFIRVLTSAAVTLLAGGAYFVFALDSAEATMKQAKDEPLESFLRGFGIGIAVVVVSVHLAITVIERIVAIPLLIVFAVVELAAQAVVFVMLFEPFLPSKPSRKITGGRSPHGWRPLGNSRTGAAHLVHRGFGRCRRTLREHASITTVRRRVSVHEPNSAFRHKSSPAADHHEPRNLGSEGVPA